MKKIAFITTGWVTRAQEEKMLDEIKSQQDGTRLNVNILCNPNDEIVFGNNWYVTGFVPWNTHNPEIQEKCDRIFSYQTSTAIKREASMNTVERLHPNFHSLTQGAKKHMARIYLAIEECDVVIIVRSTPSGGPSEFARKVAAGLNKEIITIEMSGKVIKGGDHVHQKIV
jgi:peptidoglycan hydrolase-like protein with peptidoglycan-binding domain